jgi:hypothetical protein
MSAKIDQKTGLEPGRRQVENFDRLAVILHSLCIGIVRAVGEVRV